MKHMSVFIERASPGHYVCVFEGHMYSLLVPAKTVQEETETVLNSRAVAT
jgi:hypothetical protein